MLDSAFLNSLTGIVGASQVLTDPYDLDRYSADALNPARLYGRSDVFDRLAEVVVRPSSTAQVASLVTLAAQRGVPVVPYGGGTGLMGGALPVRGGMVLDLKGLEQIVAINPIDLTATAGAGVVLQDLENALAEHGLMHGHDPYSLGIATVGGTISTNGVGYRAGTFGPMGNQVVALEVVLPDGRVLNTRAVPMYSSGPDLNRWFIGTEGTLGIITQATLRVARLPEAQNFATAAFPDFTQGFHAVGELLALGIRPTLLDLTEEEGVVRLHLLFEGFREGVAAQERRALQVCAQFGGQDVGPEPTLAYWRDRHQAGDNYRRNALGKSRRERWSRQRGRGFDYLHLALPISQVLEYRRRCDAILSTHDVQVVEYALWSRPELFSMMLVPAEGTGERSQSDMGQAVDQVLALAQDMGGIMEYCHGVGVRLDHLLPREMGLGHDLLRALKQTLDPANIMNPGKLGL
ncbi:MAG: FAD-binding oxidoreductase [Dehalococcoidia bacterium]|nr:FAD-binding oxidoreductase [Dehalococcoidia bacterium]MSQ17000.1 FAD-binding oxidoreductase [Dehalococcoidia bacterium]